MSTQKGLILVVEDDIDIADLVEFNLAREHFEVRKARNGADGFRMALELEPSLVLLDIMLPDLSGTDVCAMLRRNPVTQRLPVVFMTAKGEDLDIEAGFDLGGDDYIVKPFSMRELVARVRAVLRRTKTPPDDKPPDTIQLGPVHIDRARHEVTIHGENIRLTLAEFRLFSFLAANEGLVYSRDALLDHVTAGKATIIDRNVDVHIRSIRRKLGSGARLIATVRGVGYKCDSSLL